jgi:hypothetical protein
MFLILWPISTMRMTRSGLEFESTELFDMLPEVEESEAWYGRAREFGREGSLTVSGDSGYDRNYTFLFMGRFVRREF